MSALTFLRQPSAAAACRPRLSSAASTRRLLRASSTTPTASSRPPIRKAASNQKAQPARTTMASSSSMTSTERPPFDESVSGFTLTAPPAPGWKAGDGAHGDGSWKAHRTVSIDPYGPGRTSGDNYRLLVSGIVPRPIGFVSSVSADGRAHNLAPMSYFNLMNHDPPIFAVGFSVGRGSPKDSHVNVLQSAECTVNVISEWFVEAANFCAVDSPYGVQEWSLCGLTKAQSVLVKAPRVSESAFAVEAKVVAHHEWTSPSTGKRTGVLVILQGVYFHVREDALNEAQNMIDPAVLQPVSRMGGTVFGRTTTGYEIPRPVFKDEIQKPEVRDVLEKDPASKEAAGL